MIWALYMVPYLLQRVLKCEYVYIDIANTWALGLYRVYKGYTRGPLLGAHANLGPLRAAIPVLSTARLKAFRNSARVPTARSHAQMDRIILT